MFHLRSLCENPSTTQIAKTFGAKWPLRLARALAIVTPAAIGGLPNAPATTLCPFQWYRKAFMMEMEMEVIDRRRCHLADTAISYNKARVPFMVKMTPRWFEKVASKAKSCCRSLPKNLSRLLHHHHLRRHH